MSRSSSNFRKKLCKIFYNFRFQIPLANAFCLSKKIYKDFVGKNVKVEVKINPAIKDALVAADNFFLDESAYHAYLNRQAAIWDYNSGINTARAEGIESVALNLISMGLLFDKIQETTKLSTDKIQELAKKRND